MENAVKSTSRKTEFSSHNIDTLVICLSLCVPAIYYGRLSAFLQMISCVFATGVSEFIFIKLILKRQLSPDLSFLVTGLAVSLLLPPSTPLYIGIASCVFAVAVGVFPFGGFMNTPFPPVAVGFAFISAVFSSQLSELLNGKSLSDLIESGNIPAPDFFFVTDILSGALPGGMGCTCILALVATALYLFIRNRKRLMSSWGYLLSVAAFAFIFPRVNSGRLSSVFLELSSGCLLFVSLVLINNKVTVPEKSSRAFFYGILCGLITMLMRYFSFGISPEISALLLTCALWPSFTGETVNRKVMMNTDLTEEKEVFAP